jgi:catechol 2,3-dioxygenase-like lactoylglutathione lyase family enzyme
MTLGVDRVHLLGSDLDASERFYRDVFGAETIGRRDAGGAANLMRLDGINLLIRALVRRNRSAPMAGKSATRTTISP